ncbi:MAG: YfiR family protein [Magnetococcus sp. YQC-9]
MNPLRHLSRFLIACLMLLMAASADSRAETPTESHVKVAYLYQFTKFITWPAEAFADERTPFALCILGHDEPFGALLAPLAKKQVHGRSILIRHPTTPHEAIGCHLLYIPRSEEAHIPETLDGLRDKPVLTVVDAAESNERAWMIRFFRVRDTLRFAIQPEPAQQAGLKIHATLLEVAHETR